MQPGMSGWRGFIPPSLPVIHNSSTLASVPIVSEDTDLSPDSTSQHPSSIFSSVSESGQVEAVSSHCIDHRTLMTTARPTPTPSSQLPWFQSSSQPTSLRENTRAPCGQSCSAAQSYSTAQLSQTVGLDRCSANIKQNSNMAFLLPGVNTDNRYNSLQCRVSSSSCSSSSPGINRRNSVASSVKTSVSTDEEMRSNPNTPNLVPHTSNAAMGNVFSFDPKDFPGSTEDLQFDLDIDNDDDVFFSDIDPLPTGSLPSTSNYSTIETQNSNAASTFTKKSHPCSSDFLNMNSTASTCAPSMNTALWNAVLEACRTDQTLGTLDNNNNNVEPNTCVLTDPALLSAALELNLDHEDDLVYEFIQNTPSLPTHQHNEKSSINVDNIPTSCETIKPPINTECCPASTTTPIDNLIHDRNCATTQPGSSVLVSNTVDNQSTQTSGSGGGSCSDRATPPDAEEISSNPALLNAALEAVQSGQITPLLKHELKWVIQLRRLSQGKEEMEVNFDPPTVGQMSDAEMSKAERRRKQNRIAARKFRQKRKSVEDQLLQTIQTLKETNSNLAQKAEQLRGEKQALLDFIAEHLRVCPSLSKLRAHRPSLGDDAVP